MQRAIWPVIWRRGKMLPGIPEVKIMRCYGTIEAEIKGMPMVISIQITRMMMLRCSTDEIGDGRWYLSVRF